MSRSPFVSLVQVLFEKTAISRGLAERAAQSSLQHRTFEQIEKAEKVHGDGASRARKALKNRTLTPELMRAVAEREASHMKIQEVAKGLSAGRERALKAGTADAVAAALPRPAAPARLGGFELPHINKKKLLIGGAAGVLGMLAMKAMAKRKEVEDGYSEPY